MAALSALFVDRLHRCIVSWLIQHNAEFAITGRAGDDLDMGL